MAGRNVAGLALVDVGATNAVLMPQEVVGLDDDRVAGFLLLAAASPARRGQRNTSPRTIGPRRSAQRGHVLTDDAHLFAVLVVFGEPANFLAQGWADAAPHGRFAQRRADGLRVVQALGTHDVKCCGARVVEPHMQGARHRGSVARLVLPLPTPPRCSSHPPSAP
jgi:hypothetical protein